MADPSVCPKCGADYWLNFAPSWYFSVRQSKECRIRELEQQLAARERQLREVAERLKEAVCTEGVDKGLILLSDDGPTHPVEYEGRIVQCYDHEYFSPLGDCLIAAWEKATENSDGKREPD